MMIKGLREERSKLVKNSRALLEKAETEKRSFDAAEEAQWTAMNVEITNLGKRIERFAQLEEQEKAMATIVDHGLGLGGSVIDANASIGGDQPGMKQDEAWNTVINAWCRAEKDVRTPKSVRNQVREAAKQTRFNVQNRRMRVPLDRNFMNLRRLILKNAGMSVGTLAAGGYTIPQGFVAALETALLYFGPMLQVADVLRTDTGNPLPWPTYNDTGNTGVLLSEQTTVGASVAATYAAITFNAFKFSSQLIQISEELINDSAFDLATEVGSQCGMRLGRVGNTYLTIGTGTGQPQGIVTGATLGKTCASAIAITFDEVIDLEHAVGLAYRPRMSYMTLDSTVNALRKLKDTQGRYLWQQFANSGQPDLLNNRPLYINQDMAPIATTNKTILAGDFSKFKIRMVGEVRARRLSERYADTDQEAFISFMRMDSKVLDAGTHPIVYLQQA
jgi:HK97 family phage major capsid protein